MSPFVLAMHVRLGTTPSTVLLLRRTAPGAGFVSVKPGSSCRPQACLVENELAPRRRARHSGHVLLQQIDRCREDDDVLHEERHVARHGGTPPGRHRRGRTRTAPRSRTACRPQEAWVESGPEAFNGVIQCVLTEPCSGQAHAGKTPRAPSARLTDSRRSLILPFAATKRPKMSSWMVRPVLLDCAVNSYSAKACSGVSIMTLTFSKSMSG